MAEMYKIRTKNKNVFLRVAQGHFATVHSHTNYYIDVTTQKTRLSEAKAVAKELVSYYRSNTIVDTILCLDGTEVIGACLAEELTNSNYANMNAHQTIYIVSPEYVAGGQMMFRDNVAPMIIGKHILVLAASVTTGKSVQTALEAIQYYRGIVSGISAIFATTKQCDGIPVRSIFDPNDLGDYCSYDSQHCPFCQRGNRIEALVNSYGYSAL